MWLRMAAQLRGNRPLVAVYRLLVRKLGRHALKPHAQKPESARFSQVRFICIGIYLCALVMHRAVRMRASVSSWGFGSCLGLSLFLGPWVFGPCGSVRPFRTLSAFHQGALIPTMSADAKCNAGFVPVPEAALGFRTRKPYKGPASPTQNTKHCGPEANFLCKLVCVQVLATAVALLGTTGVRYIRRVTARHEACLFRILKQYIRPFMSFSSLERNPAHQLLLSLSATLSTSMF